MKTNSLVLASSSVYHKQLLEKLQFYFTCAHSGIDESKKTGESATLLALRLAAEKVTSLARS